MSIPLLCPADIVRRWAIETPVGARRHCPGGRIALLANNGISNFGTLFATSMIGASTLPPTGFPHQRYGHPR